ncbi:MAG: hypothetical protein CMD08_01515 [Flavobacteriales bacterium]|nr:hypothetical protein [Flavobacteriales bacterium]|tara:strand:+ start:1008 stop:1865 length:858 start_codon:yes stop_codon:yes gene_type:complete
MNNHYIKEKLPEDIRDTINNILRANNLHDMFDYNLWIAGGFPRMIQYAKLNNLDTSECLKRYFHEARGDIDIFSSSVYEIDRFFQNRVCEFLYHSPFAINMSNKYDVNYGVNIQFVNKFFYNSFESCLNSFDFTNCKYLLYKDKEDYFLLKDSRADFYNKENSLNIDICVSPLMPQRIVKYFNKHNIQSLTDTSETKKSIEEYLFKVASDSWDDKFKIMGSLSEIASTYIKNLHSKIRLSDIQLSILIGKFTDHKYVKIHGSYGFHLEYVGSTDWASDQIKNSFV